jgi:hypothetical protein
MVKKLVAVAMIAITIASATSVVKADSELSSKNNQTVLAQHEGNARDLWNMYSKNHVPASDFNDHQLEVVKKYITTDDFLEGLHSYTRTQLKQFRDLMTYINKKH